MNISAAPSVVNTSSTASDARSYDRDGWIAVARAMRSHWLVGFGHPVNPLDPERGSYSRAEAFIDLIMECRLRDGYIDNGGKKMQIDTGQLLGAVSWLGARWNWSPKTVRNYLSKLKNDGMIALSTGNSQSKACTDENHPHTRRGNQLGKQAQIITICNYAQYQLSGRNEGEQKGEQRANTGQTRGEQGATYIEEQWNKGTKEQEVEREAATAPALPPPPIADLEIAPWLPLAEPEPTPRLILVETVTPIARQDQHSGPPAQSFEFLECPPQPKAKSLPTAKSEAPSYGRHQALDAFALYNDLALKCGLPQAAKLTPQREKAVIARLKTYGIEGWLKALVKIEKSSFLRGRNDRNWRADLDFLLQASSFDKVIDGRYDDPNLAKNASGSQKTEAEREKARREMRAVAGLSS